MSVNHHLKNAYELQFFKKQNKYFQMKSSKNVLRFVVLLLIMIIEASFICLAQEPLPERAKKFGEITIPQEVDPQFIKLPASVKGDPSVSVLKIHAYEEPPRKVLFSQTKFLEIDVDDRIVDGNIKATIKTLIADSGGKYTLKKSAFEYLGLKGKRFSIKLSGPNIAVYECFQFHNKRSIWWINFIGQRSGDGTAAYAESFMRKVSFITED